ncbi:hypothetical protein ACRALDRAFT_2049242 [Sodiomyces alcalophilus JCM 7366]|uniref:uncharacterized protein n=1 Tax=Sodiomyces alcalophilus JCM 7366 TaxID=591952 RepID=UPI0039B59422
MEFYCRSKTTVPPTQMVGHPFYCFKYDQRGKTSKKKRIEPDVGIEPTTLRFRASCGWAVTAKIPLFYLPVPDMLTSSRRAFAASLVRITPGIRTCHVETPMTSLLPGPRHIIPFLGASQPYFREEEKRMRSKVQIPDPLLHPRTQRARRMVWS